ncbi:MBL fold metallo-hydrolase [Halosolutus gelatinilyticus]|uniref:MBL fold metallo-hydrolase n=1 Tax=Halosolutus gelatinilyticus TaxID=2931975 RepID=UPI001FF540DE|nr:MBL fold metallo-hydrolase [Halosolutus gelatinilyticus]
MDVQLLGGAREIGRSAVLIDDRLLLDFGMDSGNPPSFPIGDVDPEAIVVSHGHLDHVGSVPTLLSGDARPPIHWTPPTYDLTMMLARDTIDLHGGTYDCPFTEAELARVTEVSETHGYEEPFEAAGYEITFFDAGHVPGSAHVLVDDGETRLLYTGDFHTEDRRGGEAAPGRANGRSAPVSGQRLLAGTTARPEADAVLCESTYADTIRPPRAEIEREFAESLRSTIWEGGTVVVPAFAIGRTQEVLCICERYDLDCYVDGMGKRVTELFLRPRNRGFLRDPDLLRRAKGNARFVDGRDGQRKRIAEQNTVIVTTSGMLHGGPAMTYVPAIRSHPANKIAMTGYQVEGTPGRDLLDTGSAEIDGRVMRVSAQVEQYDFSAHADRSGLLEFLSSYEDATVLVNHGDRCERFATELCDDGFDATAPALGASVRVR